MEICSSLMTSNQKAHNDVVDTIATPRLQHIDDESAAPLQPTASHPQAHEVSAGGATPVKHAVLTFHLSESDVLLFCDCLGVCGLSGSHGSVLKLTGSVCAPAMLTDSLPPPSA